MISPNSVKFAVRAAALSAAALLHTAAQADVVLLGSDYLQTVQPTSFAGMRLKGLPIDPVRLKSTDTIVERQSNCGLSLLVAGTNCTIPIELVMLSLVSVGNPLMVFRESPTLRSIGLSYRFIVDTVARRRFVLAGWPAPVNDFAPHGVMNLRCRAVVFSGCRSPMAWLDPGCGRHRWGVRASPFEALGACLEGDSNSVRSARRVVTASQPREFSVLGVRLSDIRRRGG